MERAFGDTGDGLPPPQVVARTPQEHQAARLDSMVGEDRKADPNIVSQCDCTGCGASTHEQCACAQACDCRPSRAAQADGIHTLGQNFSNESCHARMKNSCVHANVSNAFPSASVYTIAWGGAETQDTVGHGVFV